jgi:MFS family permease
VTGPRNPARDQRALYAATFVRALATGMVGVLLGLYLARLGLAAAEIGAVVGAGLAGGAAATLLATVFGDRWGRRRFLVHLALLAAAGGGAVAAVSALPAIGLAAFLGMLNGMGRDRGAALVLEQAVLPATATDATRTRAFAWYNVLQDAGHALGGLLAAGPSVLVGAGASELAALRLFLGLYTVLLLAAVPCYRALSPAVEMPPADAGRRSRVSAESRRVIWRISSLFALDSLAGGFLTAALLAVFFEQRFGAGPAAIGILFFGARVANAVSHLLAARLARRFGLLNTMVFTHVPASVVLATVPFAPSFAVAAALFLLREGLVEMDVPTRQSYVMASVRPEERVVASGVTHLVRTAGWAVAPFFAGVFMQGLSLGTPLLVGAAMKLAYDALLYAAFRDTVPPEERGAGGPRSPVARAPSG